MTFKKLGEVMYNNRKLITRILVATITSIGLIVVALINQNNETPYNNINNEAPYNVAIVNNIDFDNETLYSMGYKKGVEDGRQQEKSQLTETHTNSSASSGNDKITTPIAAKLNAASPDLWLMDVTSTTVTLYAAGGGNSTNPLVFGMSSSASITPTEWQTQGYFINLTPKTTYFFWCHRMGDDNYNDSPNGIHLVTTKWLQSEVSVTATSISDTSVTLQAEGGSGKGAYEYAYNTYDAEPREWSQNANITGLISNTKYYFFARKAATNVYEVSNSASVLVENFNS